MVKIKKMLTRNTIFLAVFIIIIVIGMFSLIREQKKYSEIENRALEFFPHFSIGSFINSNYQNSFDNALADQFVFSQSIKSKMGKFTQITDFAKIDSQICKNKYVKIDDTYAIFDCSKRIVFNVGKYDEDNEKKIKDTIEKINKKVGSKIPVYYYFIDRSNTFNFINNNSIYDMSKICNSNCSKLEIKNYDDFSKKFYKTDHHWNHEGSYEGYKQIIKLLFGEDEKVIEPVELVDFNLKFKGTMARISKVTDFSDDFKAYKFDIKEHDEYIENVFGKYGNKKSYYDQTNSKGEFVNHYGNFYGADYGEVHYDFKDSEKDNLLIISNSFSNSINELIASHFNNTYVVDLRYYENWSKKPFDYKKYIKSKKIDKILILGDFNFYLSDEFQSSVEE